MYFLSRCGWGAPAVQWEGGSRCGWGAPAVQWEGGSREHGFKKLARARDLDNDGCHSVVALVSEMSNRAATEDQIAVPSRVFFVPRNTRESRLGHRQRPIVLLCANLSRRSKNVGWE